MGGGNWVTLLYSHLDVPDMKVGGRVPGRDIADGRYDAADDEADASEEAEDILDSSESAVHRVCLCCSSNRCRRMIVRLDCQASTG